jgi:GGDEF domain-containing protein
LAWSKRSNIPFIVPMALQGPLVVIADTPAPDVTEALRGSGAFPIVETTWSEAVAAVDSVKPEAIVLASAGRAGRGADGLASLFSRRAGTDALTPVLALAAEGDDPAIADALTIAAGAPPERIAARLSAALRIRALHATVLRRTETLQSRGEAVPELPDTDPLEDATVLVAGRGRSYPELSVSVGEQVGIVGALTVESAARALHARDIDGMVIGEGFSPRIVGALLTVLAKDVRFRDLPVAVLGSHHDVVEEFYAQLPNLDRVAESPARLVSRLLPFVRLHAFGERLRRMLKSLDAKGMIDPQTGLLGRDAFWRDLNRAVDDAERRGVGLSIARFAFDHSGSGGRGAGRVSLDAARLLGRLMRRVDFACREADDSIFAVFTETDLRAAHVVTRRLAAVLRHTMMSGDRKQAGIETAVTLATLKPTDNVDSLIARVVGAVAAR